MRLGFGIVLLAAVGLLGLIQAARPQTPEAISKLRAAMQSKKSLPETAQSPAPQPRASCSAPLPPFIRNVINERLRDPESARFGNAFAICGEGFAGKPMQIICGTVNAKNGFGGYSGDTNYIIVANASFIEFPAKPRTWNRYCAGPHKSEVYYQGWMMRDM